MPSQPDYRITIRLKPSEYAVLQKKAGKNPLSTYARALLLEKAANARTKTRPAPVKDHAVLAQILALLGPSSLVEQFQNTQQKIQDGVITLEASDQFAHEQTASDIAQIKTLLMHALGVAEQ